METTQLRSERPGDPSLPREIGQSLYLLALTAVVSAGSLALGLLAVWIG